ncbi:hypothetical protein ACPV5O_21355, partial [Vibrio maritimus]|uniref:hypothetical protein n=1 Tax=Vibrio maritimus TaxID=990268 RepID=UPI0040688976
TPNLTTTKDQIAGLEKGSTDLGNNAGFDGTGKTSICKKIESELGVKYIKPFEKTGEIIKWLHLGGDKKTASIVGKQSMLLELSKHDGSIYVCDRNWLSMLVFTGVDIRVDGLKYLDFVTISTEERIVDVLKDRGEEIDLDNIARFVPMYSRVADDNRILKINTTNRTIDESFEFIKKRILEFIS